MTKNKYQNTKLSKLKKKPTMRELNDASNQAVGRNNNTALFSGKMSEQQSRELQQALNDEDWDKVEEIKSQINFKSGYINRPDLKFPEGSSVQSLRVTLYSSSTKDQKILHRLLDRTN